MFRREITSNALRFVRYSKKCFTCKNSGMDHAVKELNMEMESVFGKPPCSTSLDAMNHTTLTEEPKAEMTETQPGLTHVDSKGRAQMVDISKKNPDSRRVATAYCKVSLGREAFSLVASNQLSKGDVLSVAKIAGICGAKQTSSLIPLCHNIALESVQVDLRLNEEDWTVEIEGEAATTGKTGVEMEAMTAVAIAGLTVYDMCKGVSKGIRIKGIELRHKSGGKSGNWSRE
ncbi:hypothetical protein AMTRI_Chr01g133850 [Amborella trichopoda]